MQEADLGSTKDIAELLMMAHKIRMDELKAMTDYEKVKNSSPKVQTNVQINETLFGSGNYGAFTGEIIKMSCNTILERIMKEIEEMKKRNSLS